ncbi:MAG: Demethylmenaquinone methyltransferase [Nitrosomonadaceae bacterium]|nr:Demethylmenaquinone methyltransferase [Nitrosomonadaceae bacterium]
MASVSCIACGQTMALLYQKMFDDRYGYPGYFDIYRCANCNQAQTVPLLRDEDLPKLYASYYPRREIDIQALQRQVGNPADPREFSKRRWNGTDNQGQYIAKPGMKVLDYGCGTGVSLLEIEALGAEAYGIEADPNVQQVIDKLGLRIHIGSLDDAPFGGVLFDLIVLNQVLEHIPNPETLLEKLRARLKPGGRVVLSFPNADSIFARFFKRTWINWHVPYHLHHFSSRSAHLFFERCSWKVISSCTITPNLWTVLQSRAAIEATIMGDPNPMWIGKAASQSDNTVSGKPSFQHRWRRRFILSASSPLANFMLTVFNRIEDRWGNGDSLLIELESSER